MPEPIQEIVEEEMDEQKDSDAQADSHKASPAKRESQAEQTPKKPQPAPEKSPEKPIEKSKSNFMAHIKQEIEKQADSKSRRNVFVLPEKSKNMSVPRKLGQSEQGGEKKLRILRNASVRKLTSGQNLFRSLTRSSQTGGAHSLKIIKTIIRSKKEPEKVNNVEVARPEPPSAQKTGQTVVQVPKKEFDKIKNQKSPSSQNLQMSRRKLEKKGGDSQPNVRIKKRRLGKTSARSVTKKGGFKVSAKSRQTKQARKTVKGTRSSASIHKTGRLRGSPKATFRGHKTLNLGDKQNNLVLQHLEKSREEALSEREKGIGEAKSAKGRKRAKGKKKNKYDRSIGFSFRKQKLKN